MRFAFLGISIILSLLAWYLPEHKAGAVAGRLSYPQFLLAVVSSAGCMSLACLVFSSNQLRRLRALRLTAVWLGTLVAGLMIELSVFLWAPSYPMDNPWYLATGQGLETSTHLKFVRAPSINWTGLSRGDLAIRGDEDDPSARIVTFQTDFEGFRNSTDLERAEIIFLGDSFTEAGNIPEAETFVAQVGARRGVVVRNLGRAGYSTPSELVVLRQYGLKNQPRIVVWQIAESNDLRGALRYANWLHSGKPDSRPTRSARLSGWRRLSPSYQLFSLLREPAFIPLQGVFRDTQEHLHQIFFMPRLPGPMHRPAVHPGWPIFTAALEEGIDLIRKHGATPLLVLIPMKLRVLGPYVDFEATDIAVNGRQQTIQGPLPVGWDLPPEETLAFYLQSLCERLNVALLDMTPHLKDEAASGALAYLPMDTHLSTNGHAIVGEAIVETLAGIEYPFRW